jgi:hypothetical protein
VNLPIYLDFHATTPVDPRVLETMLPYFTEHFGNAASRNHPFGWEAEEAVEKARKQVADLIGANAKEIVFTSGATESNNLAIKGVARARKARGNHIVTVATEHKAVLDSCRHLAADGFEITVLGVGPDGLDQGGGQSDRYYDCDDIAVSISDPDPPPAQRFMSERAGSTVVEVAGSHAIYVSQPDAVAALIKQAAQGAVAATAAS